MLKKNTVIMFAAIFVLALGITAYARYIIQPSVVLKPMPGDIPKIQVFDVEYRNGVWAGSKVITKGLGVFEGLENRDVLFAIEKFDKYVNSHLYASQYSDYKDLERLKEIKTGAREIKKYYDWKHLVKSLLSSKKVSVTEYNYEFKNTPEDGFMYRMYGNMVLDDGKIEPFDYIYRADYITVVEDMRANSDARPVPGIDTEDTIYM